MKGRGLWTAYAQASEQRPSKYRAKKTDYKGETYDSAGEAKLARDLDCLLQTGEVLQVERQVSFDLLGLRGSVICRHVVDFLVHYPDGSKVVYEFKGPRLRDWVIKHKLFVDNYPNLKYIIMGRQRRKR